jgi:molybdopterin synthase catalytic subunit
MKIDVKLFAILRERAGTAGLTLELPSGATAAAAGAALAERFPALREHLGKVAYAVNRSYVPPGQVLSDGDELALIPPVSGG